MFVNAIHMHTHRLPCSNHFVNVCGMDPYLFFPLDSSEVTGAIFFIAFIYSAFLLKRNILEITKSSGGL